MSLTLRLRLASGGTHTLQISPDASLASLFDAVAEASGQAADELRLSCGFPPKALDKEEEATVGSKVQNMETITVAGSAATGQAQGPSKKPKKAPARQPSGGASSSGGGGGGGGVVTLSDVSGGGGGKKRAPAAKAAGGGGGKRAKALQLGSEDGIGASLAAAVSSKKGAAALHREDPAMAFFKAAAGSALEHHQEEVLANERFKAALGGTYEMAESDDVRRADGSAAHCTVRFKVGRSWKEEEFELLALPELRGVVEVVLNRLHEGGGDGGGLELLKPFKMAHVSPRVFWNMVHHLGGDVRAGLEQLLPATDWAFLDERKRERSAKAAANDRQAAQEARGRAARGRGGRGGRGRGQAVAAADEGAAAEAPAGGPAAEVEPPAPPPAEAEAEEDVEEDETAEEAADPEAWEARGRRAMARREFDYACVCMQTALVMQREALGCDEDDPRLAAAWYLQGSALLRRAQALALTITSEGGGAPTGGEGGEGGGAAYRSAAASAADDNDSANGALAAAAAAAVAGLEEGWQREGHATLGRRVRRFFALHGMAEGQVVAWQPEGDGDDEPALWRVAMEDGDVEDLEEEELEDALEAAREGRDAAQEVEAILEAAWEALEMAVALHSKVEGRELQRAEAHERLGDAAMQNDQAERAREEYADARLLLVGLRDAGRLDKDDRRLADIEFFLGIACLRLGDAAAARQHYRQASATLRLRKAQLELSAQQQRTAQLEREVAGEAGPADAAGAEEAQAAEIAEIDDVVREIDGRLREMEA